MLWTQPGEPRVAMMPRWLVVFAVILACGCGPSVRTGGWVVRTELAEPGGGGRVCSSAATAGLDQVLVQVRGRGDAYYRSDLAPVAESLGAPAVGSEPRDPLAEVLTACADREVVAWLNVFFLWEGDAVPAVARHLVRSRPGWLLRDADGLPVAGYGPLERANGWIEGAYADPASLGYRDHFAELVRELVTRYPVDGVHLDFVRYPGPAYGQGGRLGAEFGDAWGVDPRWIPEGSRVPDLERWLRGELAPADRVLSTAALLWAERRSAQVTALLRGVRRVLDESAPAVELSAAVFPDPGNAYLAKGQDWIGWAAEGLVDALYPMVYFGGEERVAGQLGRVAARVGGDVELWAGLGAYIKDPARVGAEAATARALGYDGVCLFDVGTMLESAPGLAGYVRAVSGPRVVRGSETIVTPVATETRGGAWLAAIAERAFGGEWPAVGDPGSLLDARWAEFAGAREALLRARRSLTESVRVLPTAVELTGVFRYLHPGDGAQRRATQRQLAEQARTRLLAGEDAAVVAGELSQGGTRKLGGVLPRRYLWPRDPLTPHLRGLREGQVSPVVRVDNGFWVYRVTRREAPRPMLAARAPWPARRQWFRQALAEALKHDSVASAEPDAERTPRGSKR